MVDYTLTPNKSLIKPNRGSYVDTWDTPINNDWDYVDRALGGKYTIVVQPDINVPVDLTVDQARYQQIVIDGQTGIITVRLPLVEGSATATVGGMWIINNISNTYDIYLTTFSPGTNIITIKAGKRQTVFSNGSGIFFADDSRIEAGSGLKLVGNVLSIEGASSVLTSARGGTGFGNGFSNGQLLIGKADGTLARATLTAGSNIAITNGDGTISIASTASGGGGVSSVTFTGNTGLTFTNTGTASALSFLVAGSVGVGAGGTGASTFTAGFLKSPGTTAAFTTVANINLASDVGTTVLPVLNGGSGVTTSTGGGTGAANVLSLGPTFTNTGAGTAVTAKIGTNTSYNYVGQNTSGSTTFSVDGNGAILVADTGGYKTARGSFYNGATYTFVQFDANTSMYGNNSLVQLDVNSQKLFQGTSAKFEIGPTIQPQAYGTTTWTNVSDTRVKKNIQNYSLGINELTQLRPITYQFNGAYGTPNDNKTIVGLVAQEVQATPFSSMVQDWDYTDPKSGSTTKLYSLNTSELVFALINAVKDLDARVKELEAKVSP